MTALSLVKETVKQLKESGLANKVTVTRKNSSYVLSFNVRTTKARASSMVERARLIVADISEKISTHLSYTYYPSGRSDLHLHEIVVVVPIAIKSPPPYPFENALRFH